MKQKIPAALIYIITAYVLWGYFDGLYGTGTPMYYLWLIYPAIAGAILFVIAFALSLFSSRLGVICGLVASALSLPLFGLELVTFPWTKLVEFWPYARWADIFRAIVVVSVSSAYSFRKVWVSFRPSAVS